MSLLLEADESEPVVRSYLDQGELFTIDEDEEPRGVVLVIGEGDYLEIKNFSVEQRSRGRGLDMAAITLVINQARSRGFRRLIVGAADSSAGPLVFIKDEDSGSTEYGEGSSMHIPNRSLRTASLSTTWLCSNSRSIPREVIR